MCLMDELTEILLYNIYVETCSLQLLSNCTQLQDYDNLTTKLLTFK